MTSFALLAIACSIATISLVLTGWTFIRANRIQSGLLAKLNRLEHNLTTSMSGAIGMGSRIVNLEKKLHSIQDSHYAEPDAESAVYTQAMQLFDSGADVNAVVASCGISSSEASLMALIRQKTQQPLMSAQA